MLNPKAKQLLDSIANEMKVNPHCKLSVGTIAPPQRGGANLSWNRVNNVIQYLVKQHGIVEERFSFGFDMGEIDIVELRRTGDEVPAPKPKLKQ